MKHIICFSGGHSSAIVAIETVRKYGKENVILLNHDINPKYELPDVKRFKKAVADYLGIPITFANYVKNGYIPSQFEIALENNSFITASGKPLCTSRLKTQPFEHWILSNMSNEPDLFGNLIVKRESRVYYGFDAHEGERILRRLEALASMGLIGLFPLAEDRTRTIYSTEEIGIKPPAQYSVLKHANCLGCIKGGIQYWYVMYVHFNHIFEEGKGTEEKIRFAIIKASKKGKRGGLFLRDIEPIFKQMLLDHVPASEHYKGFRKQLRNYRLREEENTKPCECLV